MTCFRSPQHHAAAILLMMAGSVSAQTVVSMWVHAGAGPEAKAYADTAAAFNSTHKDVRIELVRLPEGSYNDQINAAALAHKLPCLLDFDGPNVYNYAWTQKLIALDAFPELKQIAENELLPSLKRQGTYNQQLYSLGQFDSGLALWGQRKLLQKVGARIPTKVSEAWSLTEFEDVLKKLKSAGVAVPLDMKLNYGMGEWFSYGFSPIVQSFGGDLINRQTMQTAQGVINAPPAVKALSLLQTWAKAGWINPSTKDDGDFIKGKSALSYVGHWVYGDYRKALGEDLVLLPMPKFGAKAVTGAGSWNFGISADCKAPKAAASVLAHLMSVDEITRVTQANGAIPGTRSALAKNRNYSAGGPLSIYTEQIQQGVALIRPATPAYPVISASFAEAVNNVLAGSDPQKELDRAARKIDQNLKDNKGYPVVK